MAWPAVGRRGPGRRLAGVLTVAAMIGLVAVPTLTAGVADAVVKTPTATVLTLDTVAADWGQVVTLTAAISVPGAPTVPTGHVTFRRGATTVGSAPLVAGTATLMTAKL